MEWIDLTEGRDRWQAIMNAVMDLWVLLAEDLLTSHEQLCSMELVGMHILFVILGFQS
jgi:hypothetical protein